MRAVVCNEFGPPENLVIADLPSPRAGKGEVVIAVSACGVNYPDALIVQGKYQFKPALPFTPGAEAAGVVQEVGEGVKWFRPGDRVIAFAFWGGFAEKALVAADHLVAMPEGLDFQPAAAFVTTYGTSYHALHDRAKLSRGETLLVLGASGGVGLAAVELGKLIGARVIAAASTRAKLEICRRYGADELIDYEEEDLRERLKALTGGRGVDVAYDPVGGRFTEPALRSMAWNGRYLVVGFAAGDIPRIPLNLPLLKGFSIIGVYWGSFAANEPQRNAANLGVLTQLIASRRLKPFVSATYALEQAPQALRDMLERRVSGKAVVITT